MNISVVIPCYNSVKSLPDLVDRLVHTLDNMELHYEIILIDDESKDKTAEAIRAITKKYNNVVGIELMYNVGQFMALMCGLEHSKGDYVITMDDDLQHSPEDIPSLYKHLQDNPHYDAVFATPKIKQHSLFRRIGSLCIKKTNEIIFNKPRNITMSAFRCLTRNLVNTMTSCKTKYPIMGPLILKLTQRISNIQVNHCKRYHGKTNYDFLKLLSTSISNIINFTNIPLKFISMLGIIISAFSFLLAAFYLYGYVFGDEAVSGFTTTVVLITFYSGVQLLSIGIIGEYIARSMQENNSYPRYYIRKIHTNE